MTTTIESAATTIRTPRVEFEVDEAQLAAIPFPARYSGRTLEAYRHDLLGFFQWGHRPGHRRARSEPCAHRAVPRLDGGPRARGLDDRPPAVDGLWLLGLNGLRVSEACATNIEDLGIERGHRTLRIVGKGNKPATVPLVPRTARTIDLAVGERHEGPILRRRDGPTPRPAHRAPVGPRCWQARRAWRRAPSRAASRVHHGGPRRRRAAARRPDRRPARRPAHDHHLRPSTTELRPPRCLCRGGVRRGRLTLSQATSCCTSGTGHSGCQESDHAGRASPGKLWHE
jgi:integrase